MSADNKNAAGGRWLELQDSIASESGLAVSVVESDGLEAKSLSNGNSICSVLMHSEKFGAECEKYCGNVHSQSEKTGKPFKFKCHAGLECIAVPIRIEGRIPSAAIIGRAFTKAEAYRIATEKAISGEWSEFAPSAVFENVLLTGSQNVELLAKKIAGLDKEETALLREFLSEDRARSKNGPAPAIPNEEKAPEPREKQDVFAEPELKTEKPVFRLPKISEITRRKASEKPDEILQILEKEGTGTGKLESVDDLAEQAGWRALFGDLLDHSYDEACRRILRYLQDQYQIGSMAWLENYGNRLNTTFAVGNFKGEQIKFSVEPDDPRLKTLLQSESSIELKQKNMPDSAGTHEALRLFPMIVGNEIKSALVIGERVDDTEIVGSIARFCKTVTAELEVLRLREELSRRSWLDIAMEKLNASLKNIDTEDFWVRLMQTTAELVRAERGSLLIYDENSDSLVLKAAIGRRADILKTGLDNLGERVALGVWKSGEALVVRNIANSGIEPAPSDWNYKTGSFISYPLVIGERKIGVLNITDRVDGGEYGNEEVQLLNSVVPQIAVAADRATLQHKAGEYEQLSVTDPLTGLLNRRYLEERLAEEIKRSSRHGYPMSFMMIDVDDFKSYNDNFLHPEGDKALKIVGHCLRETLRGADVAARYGGEEFSILLPQTTLEEAKTIAERIRMNIETAEFPHRQVTVSIGIATISNTIATVEKLIECADRALFEAKRKGKNKVFVFKANGSGQRAAIH